jgi:hypothetical protein
MWQISNRTLFAADFTWIRDADGAEVWIVAVKATYELLPDGASRIAAHQPPVNSGLVLHEDGKSPLFETDLGPSKGATDIWLVGHAHSQTGQPVTQIRIGFSIGATVRQLDVIGDRDAHNSFTAPKPFISMPLTWARCYGGSGPECSSGNPVGCGIMPQADGRHPLPNLLQPNNSSGTIAQGVGPIPRHWPQRSQYAGTYDAAWQQSRAPLQAADIDPRHWQVAPTEQQAPGHLKGGETITLQGVTPAGFAPGSIYRSILPKLSLGFRTKFYDGSIISSRSVIHSVILLPDGVGGSGPLISVIYHTALPCHAKVNQLDRTIIIEKRRPLDRALGSQHSAPDEQLDCE